MAKVPPPTDTRPPLVLVRVLVEPSPQATDAVKSVTGRSALASVKVATVKVPVLRPFVEAAGQADYGGEGQGGVGDREAGQAAGAGAADVEDLHRQGVRSLLGVGVRGLHHEGAARAADAAALVRVRGGAVAPGDDRREVGQRRIGVGVGEGGHRESAGAVALGGAWGR